MAIYAHTLENAESDAWQTLEEHLVNVADLAAAFSGPFHAAEWGRAVGLLHDIGKHRPEFQKRLTGESKNPADHKGTGARLFENLGTRFGLLGAYCVAGHHSGLPDYYGTKNGKSLGEIVRQAASLPAWVANPLEGMAEPEFPFALRNAFQASFFTRMLFSALVDADFLDTEAFMEAEKSSGRVEGPPLEELRDALDNTLAAFNKPGRINELRAEILTHCRDKAALEPGLFTLTVPTGGGKTLTSMAFALDHALLHGKRRIVYVVPYTSIIEQNAQVFRDIFPPHSVIEHHSTFDAHRRFREDGGDESLVAKRHRLACENWDSPIVVTTNVQFFESLFASKTSKCRKLHNLADAVIVLDEAQMLPVEFMDPCLRALEELAANYGTSVVLCTATQPALRREDFSCGLEGLGEHRELAPDPGRIHEAFKRTELHDLGDMALADVADMVREREQVLCIVNTRARAAELFGLVGDEPGARHLSAVMCPAHRSERLVEIRRMLADRQPCRVVSTQLVEAGVDVSFPEVIREMAGLDSITQAAGRCNREGEREGVAPVSVFNPTEGLPRAFAGQAHHTQSVLRSGKDPFSPEAITQFFKLHYWLQQDKLDSKRVMDELCDDNGEWSFREAAKKFRLIQSPMVPIIILFNGQADALVNSLRYAEQHGGILRKLQQYTVQIYESQFAALDAAGAVEWVADAYAVLCKMDYYDDMFGLTVPDVCNPEDFLA
nr:CRISPR-associated helicase Cas3' [uncultured Pseudodesulfovibrio sp.]